MMKNIRHPRLSALVALLLITLPAAGAVAATSGTASSSVTFADHFTVTQCPSSAPAKALCAIGHGNGLAPQLGTAGEVVNGTAVLAHPDPVTGCAPEYANVQLRSGGGRVTLRLTGQFCQTSATTSIEVGYYLVTGGTGQFKKAGGHGIYEFSGAFANRTAGTATHRYQGTFTA